MKDFDEIIARFGKVQAKQRDGVERFVLNQPTDKQKPRCSTEYPFCDRAMVFYYHTVINPRAPKGTVKLQCKICNRGGIVDAHQWRVDVAKSKKSE